MYIFLLQSDESADDEDRFKQKLFQQNMNLLADSGFNSGNHFKMKKKYSKI
jgi:hypothetical protein